MTEKEKIAQIIAEHLCSQGKSHKRLYGSERTCYSRDNFAECEKVSECVDALIAAGIGDTIYKVYDKCDGHNCPYNGCSGQWRCHYEGERRCGAFIKIGQFDYCDIPFVNDTVFVSREAAEARLKELKEDI